jgi:hypothetical protein
MQTFGILAAYLLLTVGTAPAQASVITFDVTGVPGISGFVQFDSTAFQQGFVPNTAILDLSISVFGSVFDLGDVVTSAFTQSNFSVTNPIIVNGFGLLADNGTLAIEFFPDGGLSGIPVDGDASLALEPSGVPTLLAVYDVKWQVRAVSEPGSVALVGVALAGLAVWRRKKA